MMQARAPATTRRPCGRRRRRERVASARRPCGDRDWSCPPSWVPTTPSTVRLPLRPKRTDPSSPRSLPDRVRCGCRRRTDNRGTTSQQHAAELRASGGAAAAEAGSRWMDDVRDGPQCGGGARRRDRSGQRPARTGSALRAPRGRWPARGPAAQQRGDGHRDGLRSAPTPSVGEVALVDLLQAARGVELDHLDVQRVVEVGHGGVVEGQVPVLPDARGSTGRAGGPRRRPA